MSVSAVATQHSTPTPPPVHDAKPPASAPKTQTAAAVPSTHKVDIKA